MLLRPPAWAWALPEPEPEPPVRPQRAPEWVPELELARAVASVLAQVQQAQPAPEPRLQEPVPAREREQELPGLLSEQREPQRLPLLPP